MSHILRYRLRRPLGILVVVLLMVPAPLTPLATQATPRKPQVGVACQGAELLHPEDADVKALSTLLSRYNITVPYAPGFGERPVTRYEFAIALSLVLAQARYHSASTRDSGSQSERALLERLQAKYVLDLFGASAYEHALMPLGGKEVTSAQIRALQFLIQKYRLSVRLAGDRNLTRNQFATALNTAREQMNQLISKGEINYSNQDLRILQTLDGLYRSEQAGDGGRIDTLEAPATIGAGGQLSVAPSQLNIRAGTNPGSRGGIAGSREQIAPTAIPAPIPLPVMPHPSGLSPQERRHRPGTFNTEGYNLITENPFFRPSLNPLSTFSIDVDTASYSNVRRFLNQGQLPPKDAVRIEEMINYFPYDYPQPQGDTPFSVTTDVAAAPWNPKHKLVQIGLKGKQLQTLQPSNLVFLVDVSGSMMPPNKLPLVKQSLCLLVNELSAQDRVTLVVYAGNAGLVLPPTPGSQKEKIMQAIDQLEAGGSTAGGAGIELAYKMAQQHFLKDGNNRVILATDGDFNVGVSSDGELVRLIEQKRDRGIFLTILGFGYGNYKDSKMEQLANKGNGNYFYIDSLMEGRKVLVNDLRGTLFTIAKDVKIQVEFNPARVQAYRLIGYENRLLRDQDFNDDTIDAGEVGSGHTVTALYEIIPTGITTDIKLPSIDPLKYQQPTIATGSSSPELMQVKVRYKHPRDSSSQLIAHTIQDRDASLESASANLKFSSAIALFGMLLRDSEFKGQATFDTVLRLANQARGNDPEGYRTEFIRLVERSKLLATQKSSTERAQQLPDSNP